MQRDAKRASPAGDQPILGYAEESPRAVAIPFWLTACVRLQPPRRRDGTEISATLANAVLPVVQALIADTIRTEDPTHVVLDRNRLARRCGLGTAQRAGWLFKYLERVGFLRVRQHYKVPGRGRDPDTFTIRTEPPLHYIGPRTHAELERALDDPKAAACVLFLTEGHRSATQNGEQGDRSQTLPDKTAGQTVGDGSDTFRSEQGAESHTLLSEVPGHRDGDQSGTVHQIDRSSISELTEIDRSSEPVADGQAPPTAPGNSADVRRLVRRLPWAAWGERHQGRPYVLSMADADALEAAISYALEREGISLEVAAQVGTQALAQAQSTPAVYVAGAFGAKKLPWWLRRLGVEPLDDDPLPLPEPPVDAPRAPGATPPAVRAPTPAAAAAELPACNTCRALAGEGLAERRVPGPDGGVTFCECVPPERRTRS
jgi:hypothetical protein